MTDSWCRSCKQEYDREYYARTVERRRERKRINQPIVRKRNLLLLWEYLEKHPCVDCGETDPIVLEFDHVKDKKYNVANMMKLSWETISAEVSKCVVRCANCHRRKTATEFGWYR